MEHPHAAKILAGFKLCVRARARRNAGAQRTQVRAGRVFL